MEIRINENLTIYNGDCLDIMPTIGSVDMVLTDPPYQVTRNKWDEIIPLDKMWPAIDLVLKNESTPIVLFSAQPFTSHLNISNVDRFKYEIIWKKSQPSGHLNCNRKPLSGHENISVFYTKPPVYNPQKTTGHKRKQVKAGHMLNTNLKSNGATSTNYGKQDHTKLDDYDTTERFPTTVVEFSKDVQKSSLHPTQKPVALLEWLIKTYSNEGDLILDFTSGSFSTAIACINTNRKFIGIEKDNQYFNVGYKRILDHLEIRRGEL